MDAERLKKIELFRGLSDHERRLIASWASELSVPAGEVVIRQSDFSYDVLAIVEGSVEVRCGEDLIAVLDAGEIVGEIGALTRDRRTATVTARTPLQLIRLTSWDLRHLEHDAPAVVDAIRGLAEDRTAAAA